MPITALAGSARQRARQEVVAVGADPTAAVELPCRIRLPDGRVREGVLPAWHHRRLQLSLIHGCSDGLVEIRQGLRLPDGTTRWWCGDDPDAFLPGGAVDGVADTWLDDALARVAAFAARPRTEVAVAPSVSGTRTGPGAVALSTRWLWVDVDRPEGLRRLFDLLLERPPQLRVATGSGGQQALWMLDKPLPARHVDEWTGEVQDWIERARGRLVRRVGVNETTVERGRLLRLAGTVDHEHGRHARIISADLARAPYRLRDLVGDLPDLDRR